MQETRPLLPVGYKFLPSDEQLIEYYLFNKISGIPDPFHNCPIREEDLYGIKEPLEIWEQFGGPNLEDGEDLYFFTHLKKKSANCSRNIRKVGSGVWQGEDGGKVIESRNSKRKVGIKKRYRYENYDSLQNGCWIMHEFTLNASLLPQDLHSSDYVLCRIRKNGEPAQVGKTKSRKRRRLDEQVEEIHLPEPVLVENHQHQYAQENQPQPLTEQTSHDHLQPFQNHPLTMQQNPTYFFEAKEENHQLSMTEQNPHNIQLSEYHQNIQHSPVTDQYSHEQHQISVEDHQFYTSSGLQQYQQMPENDQSPHHQLDLSVEDYQSTIHSPFILVDATQQIIRDQLEYFADNHRYMVHNPSNIEENQPLPATEQHLYDQHEQSQHSPYIIGENQPLLTTEKIPYDQVELPIEDHQPMVTGLEEINKFMLWTSLSVL